MRRHALTLTISVLLLGLVASPAFARAPRLADCTFHASGKFRLEPSFCANLQRSLGSVPIGTAADKAPPSPPPLDDDTLRHVRPTVKEILTNSAAF